MFEKIITVIFTNLKWVSPSVVVGILVWIMYVVWQRKGGVADVIRPLKLLALFQMVVIVFIGFFSWYKLSHSTDAVAKAYQFPHSTFLVDQMTRNVTSLLAGWGAAALLMYIMWFIFLKRGHGGMFDALDLVLLTVGAIAVGWPAVLILLLVIFCLAILGMFVLVLLKKKSLNDRLIITPYIIPSAILTLVLGAYPLAWTHLDKIRF